MGKDEGEVPGGGFEGVEELAAKAQEKADKERAEGEQDVQENVERRRKLSEQVAQQSGKSEG